jgi:hypothetical protein
VACTGIENGTGVAYPGNKTCECNATFVYVASSHKCLCPPSSILLEGICILCSPLKGKNSPGTPNTATGACNCNPTFVFNATAVPPVCQCPDPNSYISKAGKCVACTDIINGTGVAYPGNKTCECNATFIYVASSHKCLCPTGLILTDDQQCFSCATLKGKHSTGSVSSPTSCRCDKTSFFNGTSKAC